MSDHEKPSANMYTAIYEGVVTRNDDPLRLGRVKSRVPGITEPESDWAFPCGMPGGGTAQRGMFDVPKVGSEVYVFFLGGDPDKPRFFTGHWGAPGGQSEVPTQARDALEESGPEAADQIKVWETNTWVLVFDERDGVERFFIKRKRDIDGVDDEDLIGGNALMIELDATQGTLALSAPGGIVLRSLGMIDIDASIVQVAGRKVTNGILDQI